MNISFIIPTRGRIPSLERCLKSIYDLADNPSLIECVLIYDDDDDETEKYLPIIQSTYSNIIIKKFCLDGRKRQTISNCQFRVNPAARESQGKYVWVWGNDIEMKTQSYDTIIETEAELFLKDKPDRLLYLGTNNDESGKFAPPSGVSCFPVSTRESVNAMGCLFPEEIYHYGADLELYYIYKGLTSNRIIDLSNTIMLWHWSQYTGRATIDQITLDAPIGLNTLSIVQRKAYIDKLNKYLENMNKPATAI